MCRMAILDSPPDTTMINPSNCDKLRVFTLQESLLQQQQHQQQTEASARERLAFGQDNLVS